MSPYYPYIVNEFQTHLEQSSHELEVRHGENSVQIRLLLEAARISGWISPAAVYL